jgi:pyruvate dehydrogenase E1 component
VPACQAYDPAFAYEVAAIVQAGLQRMYGPTTHADEHDVFYYITLYNENAVMPPRQEGLDPADIVRCLYRWQPARTPLVSVLLGDGAGPIVAVTDFMKIVPEQIARFVPNRLFVPLGTDGMGLSYTREALRAHFEVDTGNVVVAVLSALRAQGEIKEETVADAIRRFGIDPDAPDPRIA